MSSQIKLRFNFRWLLVCHMLTSITLVLANQLVLAQQDERPNVLFIAVDDLNDYVLGLNPFYEAKTPNLRQLAKRGVLFTNAHCAAPVCNPSRVSVITGISPATSGVYINKDDWRENEYLRTITTLPQHFRDNGYEVIGGGKLYHAANLSEKMLQGYFDPRPWDEYFPSKQRQLTDEYVPPGKSVNGSNQFYGGRFDWDALDATDNQMGDAKVVAWAEKQLSFQHNKPVFLSVGIYRPHIPWYTPKAWFEKYPVNEIKLPQDPAKDIQDLPETGIANVKSHWHKWLVTENKWVDATQAYLASVSFADAMIGRLIQALFQGPLADNTVIVFWSDHGYHLGHKQHWEKRVLWEQATHVPLIVVDPRADDTHGTCCASPVSLLDVFPTLCDLCKLGVPDHLEGESLVPLIRQPDLVTGRAVVTTYQYNNHSIRSADWRYIRYDDGSEELYDHRTDPSELNNLAGSDDPHPARQSLMRFFPKNNAAQQNKRIIKNR